MIKNAFYIAIILTVGFIGACTSASAPGNSNQSGPNSNVPVNVPPEFSGTPIAPDGKTTPGIPPANQANITNIQRGATPIPGIPDANTIGKTPVPKGATPTPGIPDEKTLKEQMNRVIKDPNAVNRAVNTATTTIDKSVKKNLPRP
jgi:hypothetical protein